MRHRVLTAKAMSSAGLRILRRLYVWRPVSLFTLNDHGIFVHKSLALSKEKTRKRHEKTSAETRSTVFIIFN